MAQSISLHKIHLSERSVGVILAICILALFAMSALHIFWFILGTVALVAVMCVFLFRWHRRHKLEFNDLSTLEDSPDKDSKD